MGSSRAEGIRKGREILPAGGDGQRCAPPDARPHLIEAIEDGLLLVAVIDADGRISWANDSLRRSLIDAREGWDGTFRGLLSKESASLLQHMLPVPGGSPRTAEVHHPVHAGQVTIFYQFFALPGGRILAIGSDRTEEKELVAQMAALVEDLNKEIEEKSELSRRLEQMARTDFLTEVANRREFDEALKQEWGRMRRYGNHFALILFDIDHFKVVNDRHGHQAGDEVLREVARVLKGGVRAEDIVARYGGEEFAVIALAADGARGRELGDRLRAKMAATSMPGDVGTVTISGGVSSTQGPEPPRELADLLARADRALYMAKENGRNRVEVG